MSTLHLRQRLVDIAKRDVGKVEISHNRAPWIAKFWPATDYPNGHRDRAPYCASAVAYWVREWLKDKEVLAALNMTPDAAEKWRCKSAAAFAWNTWAVKKKLFVIKEQQDRLTGKPRQRLRVGDLFIFDMSHIAIVTDDIGNIVRTVEANTGANGSREGDGCFEKQRDRKMARFFVRLMDP
jgi:hypothetical protein